MKKHKNTVKEVLLRIKTIIIVMTIEIVSLLKKKAITVSYDAVTVNKTKAWTGARKTFKLSENPPVNIMVNGSPTINNFPIFPINSRV